MKFYRGIIDVGRAPVRHQVQRGFVPMTLGDDRRLVALEGAKPDNPMSAAEVVVLRHLFGNESVTQLRAVDEQPRLSFAAERDRLEGLYGDKVIERLFGPRGVKAALPRELDEDDDAYFDKSPVPAAEAIEAGAAA
jgi:hypothetical protein